jgi:DNA-binding transcriptional LysR family regulator
MTFTVGFVTGATPDKWARVWRERSRERLELVPVTEETQLDGVRDGSHSMALVRLPVDRDGLHLIPLYEELPVAVMSTENTLTLLDEVTQEDLAGEHQDWGDLVLDDVVATVAAGTGVAVVPMSVARLHHRKDLTYRLLDGAPSAPVALAWPVDRTTDDVDDFVGIVRGRTANSSRGRRGEAEEPAPKARSDKRQQPGAAPGARGGGARGAARGRGGKPAGRRPGGSRRKPR